jgi:hypothetical protein
MEIDYLVRLDMTVQVGKFHKLRHAQGDDMKESSKQAEINLEEQLVIRGGTVFIMRLYNN